jgi:hypothetical protein
MLPRHQRTSSGNSNGTSSLSSLSSSSAASFGVVAATCFAVAVVVVVVVVDAGVGIGVAGGLTGVAPITEFGRCVADFFSPLAVAALLDDATVDDDIASPKDERQRHQTNTYGTTNVLRLQDAGVPVVAVCCDHDTGRTVIGTILQPRPRSSIG